MLDKIKLLELRNQQVDRLQRQCEALELENDRLREERLISEPEFRRLLGGISHPTFWQMEQKADFPQHINFGRRKVWAYSEAVIYIKNLVVFSREG